MRYESPLNSNAFRIDEETRPTRTTEGQRINIRPLAGSAVGATVPTGRVSLLEESRFVGLVLCILSLNVSLFFDYNIDSGRTSSGQESQTRSLATQNSSVEQ
jgi:hypothetical protein